MQKWLYTKGLHDLGNGCYAYLQPDGTWGYSNAGLIVDAGESLLIDTLMDLKLTQEMLSRMRAAEPAAATIGTLVNTHSNPDHTNGNQLIANAQVIASTACLEEMKEQTSAPRYPMTAEAGAFFQEVLGSRFDLTGIRPALPSRTFDRELTLHVGTKELHLLELGPAHTRGDIVIHMPADRTVFTGDILFVDGHPVIWAGPVGNWVRACDRILEWDGPNMKFNNISDTEKVSTWSEMFDIGKMMAAANAAATVPSNTSSGIPSAMPLGIAVTSSSRNRDACRALRATSETPFLLLSSSSSVRMGR